MKLQCCEDYSEVRTARTQANIYLVNYVTFETGIRKLTLLSKTQLKILYMTNYIKISTSYEMQSPPVNFAK